MLKPSDTTPDLDDWEEHRRRVIGLGENSFRKSYYPELRRNIADVKNLLLAIEQSPRGLFVCLRHGEVEYINQTLLTLSGCRYEELVGRQPHALWSHVIQGEQQAAAMLAKMSNGEGWGGDLQVDTGAAPARWLHLTVAPITDDAGDVTHFLGSLEDISTRRQAEEELKAIASARTQALAAAERLSALKSEFMANVSHELRTPIFQILGLAHLGERVSSIERAKEFAHKIRESGDRLMQIVETLLDFSVAENGQLQLHPTTFPLSEMLDELAGKWRNRAAVKGLAFVVKVIPPEPPVITADRRRLQQLLDEVLKNAVKFTAHGQVTLSAICSAESLEFAVTDTGIGMTAEQADNCLRAFTQADGSSTRHFGGMGLGLALVTHLTDLMQGKLVVDSALGEGTTFRLRLSQIAA